MVKEDEGGDEECPNEMGQAVISDGGLGRREGEDGDEDKGEDRLTGEEEGEDRKGGG